MNKCEHGDDDVDYIKLDPTNESYSSIFSACDSVKLMLLDFLFSVIFVPRLVHLSKVTMNDYSKKKSSKRLNEL